MERNQDEVLDGSCSAAQSPLQDAWRAVDHLFEIIVHRAGNIEDKGQRGRAVIRDGALLHRRTGWSAVRADTQRQKQEFNQIHSYL